MSEYVEEIKASDLYKEEMSISTRVKKRTKLKNYRTIMQILERNEKQLRQLRKSHRINNLPEPTQKQIETTHKKVNSTLNSVAERFQTEYGMKPFEWLNEVQ